MARKNFPCFKSASGLHQQRLGDAFGFWIFPGELRELHFRATPHAVLKRICGGGEIALFTCIGAQNPLPAQSSAKRIKNQWRRKSMPNSKQRPEAKKARNARANVLAQARWLCFLPMALLAMAFTVAIAGLRDTDSNSRRIVRKVWRAAAACHFTRHWRDLPAAQILHACLSMSLRG